MHYTFRPATAADQPVIWEMLYQSLWVPEGQEPMSRQMLQDPRLSLYAADWGRPVDIAMIAVADGDGDTDRDRDGEHALGAAWCRRFTQEAPGYGFIAEDIPELGLAVMPDMRGQGLGTALLNALISAYRNNSPATSVKALSLSVMRGNPVIRLYQRAGFRIISETEVAYRMKLDL